MKPRCHPVNLRHLVMLLGAGWTWAGEDGRELCSPTGRRRWTVRETARGHYQLEPPFPGQLALTQPPEPVS